MKKLITIFSLLTVFLVGQAQTDVYLKINHKLDGNNFAYNQTATSNGGLSGGGSQYQLTRLEYYLGAITLTHDSGITTTVPNKWLLINGADTTNELLGNFNITNLQSISFGIGVESFVNHNDPNLYASTHPLAPKSPSMHWGWSAGYRFVALEGKVGTNFGQIFQVHALGDRNYHTQTHNVTGYMQNGDLIIELDADYNEALNNITVNSNLLYHGEMGEAITTLSNFQTAVFAQTTVGLNEIRNDLVRFGVSPNPSSGVIQLKVDQSFSNLSYQLLDLTGRVVQKGVLDNTSNHTLTIDYKGIYMINLLEDGILIGSEKVIVQ